MVSMESSALGSSGRLRGDCRIGRTVEARGNGAKDGERRSRSGKAVRRATRIRTSRSDRQGLPDFEPASAGRHAHGQRKGRRAARGPGSQGCRISKACSSHTISRARNGRFRRLQETGQRWTNGEFRRPQCRSFDQIPRRASFEHNFCAACDFWNNPGGR